MRAYLAGPMTFIPQFNVPAFLIAAGYLRDRGIEVVLPADLENPEWQTRLLASDDGHPGDYPGNNTWADFLASDIKLIADGDIDAIIVLPGWEVSRGARLETFVANGLDGKPVLRYRAHGRLTKVPRSQLLRAWNGFKDAVRHG